MAQRDDLPQPALHRLGEGGAGHGVIADESDQAKLSRAWAELFVPALGQISALPTPITLFASALRGHDEGKSRRPEETITPLAKKLDRPINLDFTKGQEDDLAVAVAEIALVTLVCWQHEGIPAISRALAPDLKNVPAVWPGDRFNVIFRFRRPDGKAMWSFDQVIPVMLQGDQTEAI